MRAHLTEGRRWLEGALARGAGAPAGLRVQALLGAGIFALVQTEFERARTLLEESLTLAEELGDARATMRSLNSPGVVAWNTRHNETAARRYEEALAIGRELGETKAVGDILSNLGAIASEGRQFSRARALYEEALDSYGETLYSGRVNALLGVGLSAFAQGEHAEAASFFRDGLAAAIKLDATIHRIGSRGDGGGSRPPGRPPARGTAARGSRRPTKGHQRSVSGGERADYELLVAPARAALDESSFAAEWKTGGALSMEQAVELALGAASSDATTRRGSGHRMQPAPIMERR